ncbi:hypothetical protein BN2537_14821 [Streptomyces venezuelae]|nr:hypothetical protein BN2537_14821 [Streptomyces venezuelae]
MDDADPAAAPALLMPVAPSRLRSPARSERGSAVAPSGLRIHRFR